jgi:hypothetical protein
MGYIKKRLDLDGDTEAWSGLAERKGLDMGWTMEL